MIEDADRSQVGRRTGRGWRGRCPGSGKMQAFGLLVRIVLGAGARHEMVGVAAAPRVAAVAEDQAVGDRSVLDLPGEAVGESQLVLEVEAAVAVLEVALPDVTAAQRVGASSNTRYAQRSTTPARNCAATSECIVCGGVVSCSCGQFNRGRAATPTLVIRSSTSALSDSFSGVSVSRGRRLFRRFDQFMRCPDHGRTGPPCIRPAHRHGVSRAITQPDGEET